MKPKIKKFLKRVLITQATFSTGLCLAILSGYKLRPGESEKNRKLWQHQ